jgi:hypothetical protein
MSRDLKWNERSWLRLRAVSILKLGTVDALYKRMPLCARAVQLQLRRGRLSDAASAAMVAALGIDAWDFVCGKIDTLSDSDHDV